jgi:hypothetical protein
MKLAHKSLLVAGLIATMGLAANAQPAPPPGAGPMSPMGEHRGDPKMMHEQMQAHMQERMAHRMTALKQKLEITPAQEGAWNAWTAAMKPPANMKRPERGEFENLTTPERIDRMRAMRTTRNAEMDRRADATKTFYAALSPQQKKLFDVITEQRFAGGGQGHHPRW